LPQAPNLVNAGPRRVPDDVNLDIRRALMARWCVRRWVSE
jgi:hypothetical protein